MDNMADEDDSDKYNEIERRSPRIKIIIYALRTDKNDKDKEKGKDSNRNNNHFRTAFGDARRKDFAKKLLRILESDGMCPLRRAFVQAHHAKR